MTRALAGRISYSPPKSQGWGHSVSRLSPVQLYELTEMFLREQTIQFGESTQEFTILWEPANAGPIAATINALPLFAGPGREDRTGSVANRLYRRISQKVELASLRGAVELVQNLEPELKKQGGLACCTLHRSVQFRWRDSSGSSAAVPERNSIMMLGISFGRPRGISTMFGFDSVQHYRRIQEYLKRIGLATLSDKHIRPKDALACARLD